MISSKLSAVVRNRLLDIVSQEEQLTLLAEAAYTLCELSEQPQNAILAQALLDEEARLHLCLPVSRAWLSLPVDHIPLWEQRYKELCAARGQLLHQC